MNSKQNRKKMIVAGVLAGALMVSTSAFAQGQYGQQETGQQHGTTGQYGTDGAVWHHRTAGSVGNHASTAVWHPNQ
jgi:hypothetical protein